MSSIRDSSSSGAAPSVVCTKVSVQQNMKTWEGEKTFVLQAPPVRNLHTNSMKWINPAVEERNQRARLNAARRRFCPNSCAWTADFDLAQHRKDMQEAHEQEQKVIDARNQEEALLRQRLGDEYVEIKPAFGGKVFNDNFAPVTYWPTVFTPSYDRGREKPLPDWPSKAEMKYEGDDRISTDRIHGRVLGAPRVPGNETVNWQHRSIIDQYPFDDFLFPVPQAVDIFLRSNRVDELEFTDEEGEQILGSDLMQALNLDMQTLDLKMQALTINDEVKQPTEDDDDEEL